MFTQLIRSRAWISCGTQKEHRHTQFTTPKACSLWMALSTLGCILYSSVFILFPWIPGANTKLGRVRTLGSVCWMIRFLIRKLLSVSQNPPQMSPSPESHSWPQSRPVPSSRLTQPWILLQPALTQREQEYPIVKKLHLSYRTHLNVSSEASQISYFLLPPWNSFLSYAP